MQEIINEEFQSYLSPCLTDNGGASDAQNQMFQSYLSPCLTQTLLVFYIQLLRFNPTLVRV